MRTAFLLHELGRAGGMGVVTGHARRIGADIVLTRPGGGRLDGVRVLSLDEAREVEYDVVLATWWETAAALWELKTRQRAVFVQSVEERFYGERDVWERYGAASVFGLPVHFVVIGEWLRGLVAELRPDALCPVVRNGIDKAVFEPAGRALVAEGAPLRVLVEGQPDLWFKGVREAIAAARAASQPVTVTAVVPDPADVGDLGADRVTGSLDAAGMAAVYRDHDVLVKLSRVEGVALGPIEAMHCGTPCITTPVTGHEEYVVHGRNGLVVGFDDPGAATAAVDALAADRALLARLSEGALATAAEWPSVEESSAAFAEAVGEVAAAPPLDPAPALALAASRQRLAIEQGRPILGKLKWNEDSVAHLKGVADGLRGEIAELDARAVALQETIDEMRDERAYKAAVRARQLAKRVTGRPES